MVLREICTTEVVVCGPRTTAIEAAQLMRHRYVGDVVVVDDPVRGCTPLGIVTDRDLAIEVLGSDRDLAGITVSDLMQGPVVIAAESEDAGVVIERMRVNGVRRVPLVDERGAVTGIVTLDDLFSAVLSELQSLVAVQKVAQRHEQVRRGSRSAAQAHSR